MIPLCCEAIPERTVLSALNCWESLIPAPSEDSTQKFPKLIYPVYASDISFRNKDPQKRSSMAWGRCNHVKSGLSTICPSLFSFFSFLVFLVNPPKQRWGFKLQFVHGPKIQRKVKNGFHISPYKVSNYCTFFLEKVFGDHRTFKK